MVSKKNYKLLEEIKKIKILSFKFIRFVKKPQNLSNSHAKRASIQGFLLYVT